MRVLFSKSINWLVRNYRVSRLIFFATADFVITFLSVIVAIFLYTRFFAVAYSWSIIFSIIGIIFLVKLISFSVFRIYDISFQYPNILYILKIFSVLVCIACINYFLLGVIFPEFWLLTVALLAAISDIFCSICFRIAPLVYYELSSNLSEGSMNTLIYGCGDTGKSLIPVLRKNNMRIKGFVDDNSKNTHKVVNGIKVMGRFDDLKKIIERMAVDNLIVAIPSLNGKKIKNIMDVCLRLNIKVKVIPPFYKNYNKDIEELASSIRNIRYSDLIRRSVKKESFTEVGNFFKGQKILITGGGSIGSELVKQLINFDVEKIVVLDNNELNIFNLENDIAKDQLNKVEIRLVDLKNKKSLESIFDECHAGFVFHTAAYKHVPIVEKNPCESVLNNLLCLKNTYELSKKNNVTKFIFVSSDKAVRSTNIMGATKRLGELYVQSMGINGLMISSSVRFGNVLGSSGSLIPKIENQIMNNAAVTVTHPEASRFFMLVSEAALLILKSSIIASNSEIFILDMGEPVKIIDMVEEVIRFHGKVPVVDVPIEYIGLRPGEKLFEELIFEGVESKIYKDGIYIAKPNDIDHEQFIADYNEILSFAMSGNKTGMLGAINKYVTLDQHHRLFNEVLK